MKTLKFKKIDAFTKGISSGNPAGYVYMENEILKDEEMQQIAVELKGFVNEVGFVSKADKEFNLKFFSSECEVAFCGHATIAIMYDLLSLDEDLLHEKEVAINVKAGKLPVFNSISEDDAVYIAAPMPKFYSVPVSKKEIASALSIDLKNINSEFNVRLIDGGLRTLLVPISDLESCLNIYPNQENLRLFCLDNEIDIVHVFTKDTALSSSKYRTRVFAPKFGYLEDPATGSGNAAFGYYLIDEKLWDGPFTVEQGPSKENPNFVKIKYYEAGEESHILFGGCGTTRIEGSYCLHGNEK